MAISRQAKWRASCALKVGLITIQRGEKGVQWLDLVAGRIREKATQIFRRHTHARAGTRPSGLEGECVARPWRRCRWDVRKAPSADPPTILATSRHHDLRPVRRQPCRAEGLQRTMAHDDSSPLCAGPRSARPADLSGLGACFCEVALAAAQFAEPVLFGRIIDSLAHVQGRGRALSWSHLLPLVAAWVGFGLFMIVCGALVALYADRLAHRRRQAVLSEFFEHVLQLPLSFHGATDSGRLMKVMLTGTDSLWWLWLGFFREDLAALASIFVLIPMSLYLNWRLGLLLIGLCLIFVVLTAWVLRRTEALQELVERYYSDLAERASDALGNVALAESFTRVEGRSPGPAQCR